MGWQNICAFVVYTAYQQMYTICIIQRKFKKYKMIMFTMNFNI